MAVERANWLLLKLLAVAAFAMAMDRLPGHASGSLRITEHRTPCRSTIADHIRLGLNKPPLAPGSFTTTASCACRFLTTPSGMLQPSSAIAGKESIRPAAAVISPLSTKLSRMIYLLRLAQKTRP